MTLSSINPAQKRHLRSLAHSLRPVVIIGNAGISDTVLKEMDERLEHHELIKVRVNAEDRDSRRKMIDAMCDKTGAMLVQTIGHIAVFYRRAEKPKIKLP